MINVKKYVQEVAADTKDIQSAHLSIQKSTLQHYRGYLLD
jgi:hypothetical protein